MSDTPGTFTVVGGVDGAIVRHLIEQPDFIARVEAVLTTMGSPEPRSTAQALRIQVAAHPVVYNQYAPDRLVSNITDIAIQAGISAGGLAPPPTEIPT
jgi:hypothetical protein